MRSKGEQRLEEFPRFYGSRRLEIDQKPEHHLRLSSIIPLFHVVNSVNDNGSHSFRKYIQCLCGPFRFKRIFGVEAMILGSLGVVWARRTY